MSVTGFVDSVGRDLRHALRTLPRRPDVHVRRDPHARARNRRDHGDLQRRLFGAASSRCPIRIRTSSCGSGTTLPRSAPSDLTSSPTMYFTYRDENRTLAEIGFWTNGGETLTRTDGTDRVRSLRSRMGCSKRSACSRCADAGSPKPSTGPRPKARTRSSSRTHSRRADSAAMAALGRDLLINSRPAQVVGIMPPDFRFLDMSPPFEVIVAMRMDPARAAIGGFGFDALARLKPGVTPAEASAEFSAWCRFGSTRGRWCRGYSVTREAMKNWRITPVVRPLKDDMVGGIASALWVLMGAIGAVLLVACANIANLMLVRADARRPEFAVRAALGAMPAHIARELLVESLVIGAIGGALGLVLAYGGLELLVAIGPSNLPRLEEIAVHLPVLAFTVAVSLASTLAFGSITALKHARHVDVQAFAGARGSSAGRERTTTRNALVVVQVALALVLVVSAVLMIRTFQALRDVDPGFAEPATIQTVRTWVANQLIRDPAEFARVSTRSGRDCRDSGRRIRRLYEHAADGRAAIRQHRERRDRRTNARGRRSAAATQNEARLAGLLRNHGQPDHRRPRPDVGRHRSGRPRCADLGGIRS